MTFKSWRKIIVWMLSECYLLSFTSIYAINLFNIFFENVSRIWKLLSFKCLSQQGLISWASHIGTSSVFTVDLECMSSVLIFSHAVFVFRWLCLVPEFWACGRWHRQRDQRLVRSQRPTVPAQLLCQHLWDKCGLSWTGSAETTAWECYTPVEFRQRRGGQVS